MGGDRHPGTPSRGEDGHPGTPRVGGDVDLGQDGQPGIPFKAGDRHPGNPCVGDDTDLGGDRHPGTSPAGEVTLVRGVTVTSHRRAWLYWHPNPGGREPGGGHFPVDPPGTHPDTSPDPSRGGLPSQGGWSTPRAGIRLPAPGFSSQFPGWGSQFPPPCFQGFGGTFSAGGAPGHPEGSGTSTAPAPSFPQHPRPSRATSCSRKLPPQPQPPN